MSQTSGSKQQRFDVVVIGGGQAGLSVGYHLRQRGVRFVILDAAERVGDAWRQRWDSLRLFSPARYDALEGMPFPAPSDYFPTKDEMADYLEAYAKHFELPVRTGTRVERVWRSEDRYVVATSGGAFEADQVVVAMAGFQRPRVPDFARELSADVVQLHSSAYRSPADLRPGAVLVAGAGNSGAEIAIELAKRGIRTLVSGRDVGAPPFDPTGFFGRRVALPLMFRVLFHRILTIRTRAGRKARAKQGAHGATPLIRTRRSHLLAAGAELVPKVQGVQDGKPVLEDGRVLDVENVIWCTGYRPAHSFVDLPIFDEHGEPKHDAGVVHGEPGLYFVGLHFLFAMSSAMIHGVGRDARRVVDTLMRRRAASHAVAIAPQRAAIALPARGAPARAANGIAK